MPTTRLFSPDRIFVMVCTLGIAVGAVGIAAMAFAAYAFSTATTITLPLIANFVGFRDGSGSPAVTVTGSWPAVGVVVAILAALLLFVTLRLGSARPRLGRVSSVEAARG